MTGKLNTRCRQQETSQVFAEYLSPSPATRNRVYLELVYACFWSFRAEKHAVVHAV